ncbi:MAG: hypothetical protein ABI854_04340 [Betaproteobacteria bacterium]
MSPALRLHSTITALLTSGFVFAAPGDAPIDSMDLGAMKLKPRVSAPVAAPVSGAVSPTPSLIPKSTATPGAATPIGIGRSVVAPGVAPATSPSAATAPSPVTVPAQSGIGTAIQSPIGSKRAIDIVAAPANKPGEEKSSTDVQVKMPSMFRR